MSSDNAAPILSPSQIIRDLCNRRRNSDIRADDKELRELLDLSHAAQREEIQRLTKESTTLIAPLELIAGHEYGLWPMRAKTGILARNRRIAEQTAELSALRAELATLRSTTLQAESDLGAKLTTLAQTEAGKYRNQIAALRAELEAVKAAEGELEVWLCPVHKSLDESRKLEPLGNCVACIRAERNELRRVIETVFRAWPNIRQLIDGWKSGTPADEWSEWDEQVRQETIALSFLMQPVIDAAISQTAQPEEKR